MTRPNSIVADAWNEPDAPRSLASWYAEGVSDGLGDRLLMFDNSGTASLELLRFRPELAAVSGFEEALRERTAQLIDFAHPAFPQVRAVEHLVGGGLALVSTFTVGERLAEIFRNPRTRSGVHPAFAAWLIRDLTSALAELQQQGRGIAHAGLTPDRIVIAPDGRLMIVEHVLGAALDRLRFPTNPLWKDLDLIAPANDDGTPRLDCRTDVIQLGSIVLSALIGRRMTAAEYPWRVEALVEEFVRVATPRSPTLVAKLRTWLERALQVRGDGFGSAIDARDGLVELGGASGSQVAAFMARHPMQPLVSERPRQLTLVEPVSSPAPLDSSLASPPVLPPVPSQASPAVLPPLSSLASPPVFPPVSSLGSPAVLPPVSSLASPPVLPPVSSLASPPELPPVSPLEPSPALPLVSSLVSPPVLASSDQWGMRAGEEREQSSDLEIPSMAPATDLSDVENEVDTRDWAEGPPTVRIGRWAVPRAELGWGVALVFMLVAVAEGIMLSRGAFGRPAVPPAPAGFPVTVASIEPGDAVIVDGRQVGVTPLALTLTSDVKSIQVRGSAAPATVDVKPAQPPALGRAAGDPTSSALAEAVRDRRGGLELVSPVEIQVLEGDRVLGSSADGPVVTTVGRHELEFVNAAVGYRSRQVVDITPGKIVKMTVSLPDGRVSVNAAPWAQVWINGKLAGDTPLANLPLPVGEHQVTFRHPQFGEQTQRVVVKSGALTRVSATFAR